MTGTWPTAFLRRSRPKEHRRCTAAAQLEAANGCKGSQAVFGSPVGPPQSGQRASDENRPTLARSGAPFQAPELGLRHSKVRRRRLQSPEQRLGANATGAALVLGAAARLLNACSAARGTDATGRIINRCLRKNLSIPSLESDARCGLPTALLPRSEGPLPQPLLREYQTGV